jgi:hypothetical protein
VNGQAAKAFRRTLGRSWLSQHWSGHTGGISDERNSSPSKVPAISCNSLLGSREAAKPRSQEVKKSRSQEGKKARRQEVKKSRSQEVKKARRQEGKKRWQAHAYLQILLGCPVGIFWGLYP